MPQQGVLRAKKAWKSRVEVEVRVQACLVRYHYLPAGGGISMVEFGVMMAHKFDEVSTRRVAGEDDVHGGVNPCGWIARCCGNPCSSDENGRLRWSMFEVIMRFPRRMRFEKSLSRLRLRGMRSGGNAVFSREWRVDIHDQVPPGKAWREWFDNHMAYWRLYFTRDAPVFGHGLEEVGLLGRLFIVCRGCASGEGCVLRCGLVEQHAGIARGVFDRASSTDGARNGHYLFAGAEQEASVDYSRGAALGGPHSKASQCSTAAE
jgi:hypothetical protein